MVTLEDRVAVITGGAGSIGSETTRLFAKLGATTVICDRDARAAQEVRQFVESAGGRCETFILDGCQDQQVIAAVERISTRFSRVDILVHLIGGTLSHDLTSTDMVSVRSDIETNLTSALLWAKTVLPVMSRTADGAMVFCSSVNAILGGFDQTSYASAKAGIEALVRTLTAEHGGRGIRFNCVSLGTIPGTNARWRARFEQDPQLEAQLTSMYPLGRLGTPTDAARAIAFLASSASDWISGVSLSVDGGITATGGVSMTGRPLRAS